MAVSGPCCYAREQTLVSRELILWMKVFWLTTFQFPCRPKSRESNRDWFPLLSFFTDVSLHLKAYHIITEWEVTCEAWYIFGVMTPTDARLFCNHTDMSLNNILDCQWFYTQYAKTLSFTSQCVHLVFCILLFFLLFYSILLTWNKPEMFPKDFQFTSTPSTNTLNTSTGPTLTVHSHL